MFSYWVMIFARKQSRFGFCLRSDICTDSDILKSLEIDCNEYTVKRKLHEIVPNKNTILCGDLNAHHSWWNSAITNSKNADKLIDWLDNYDFELLNKPD